MVWKPVTKHKNFIESEVGTVRKQWKGRIKVALIYPNTYHVGMSNLGFQVVYDLLNKIEHVVCERAFLPENTGPTANRITTVESGNSISNFDIVAFSVSFENDYPNILTILEMAGLPLRTSDRGSPHPLIVAGGIAFFSNPEPMSSFIDCFLLGEAESILPQFFNLVVPDFIRQDKTSFLLTIARNLPGTYVPAFYRPTYSLDGTLRSFEPTHDVPGQVERRYTKDLSAHPACSAILTRDTIFNSSFLIEVSRGCAHGCRFCSTGFIYRPPRFRPFSLLEKCIEEGASLTNQVGLIGASVSDLPDINKLCVRALENNIRIAFSSLRADMLSPELISILKKNRVKTATIAPDAGSERMRKVINKGIVEEDILQATESLVAGGIPNLKLYFMIGLPTETMEDVDAIIALCKQIKHRFLKSSRARKRMGEITVSLSSFVPKPFTPFQWVSMNEISALKKKIKRIKNGLKREANIRIHADIPRWAYIQALFSRGDRSVAQILLLGRKNSENWPKTLKASAVNSDFYVYRERDLEELFPWDFIDHGIDKSFLKNEYLKALEGKTTPSCPLKSCNICGVCKENSGEKSE